MKKGMNKKKRCVTSKSSEKEKFFFRINRRRLEGDNDGERKKTKSEKRRKKKGKLLDSHQFTLFDWSKIGLSSFAFRNGDAAVARAHVRNVVSED